ncbi:MAG: hypothetical protein HOH50_03205 [Planctomycetaceae bacterium]|nr:hypothetical protein [Planctomycetaceae bacterium]
MVFLTKTSFSWWRSLFGICVALNLCTRCCSKEPAIVLSSQVKQSLFGSVQGASDNPVSIAPVLSRPRQGTRGVPKTAATNGEDIGMSDVNAALLQIELQMKTATRNLRKLEIDSEKSIGEIQQLQIDIIRQLTKVIDREQTGPQSVFSETPTAGASGQTAGVGVASETATADAEGASTGSTLDLTPQELAQRQLLLWNHLPPRVRTQLRDAAANPFIARYERLIEQFYLRLNQQKPIGQQP